MSEASTISEIDILTDVINSGTEKVPPELARMILEWKFSDRAIAHMNRLAEKNAAGTIDSDELAVLEKYLRVGSFVNLVQAKARQSVSQSPAGE